MKYYSSKKVTEILGVTAQTLRNWDKEGKLKPSYVKSNGYRYYSEDLILSYTQERKTKKNLNVIGYARVSSKKQFDDLERQVNNLKTYLDSKYTDYEIITDIGSGINYTKPGLKKLIERINRKEVDLIVVLYKDRLLRFGFELVEYFAELNNVKIEILDKIDKNQNQELVEDLVQIVTVFSSKIQGKRKAKTKEIIDEFSQKIEKIYNNEE
ncbi:MAG: IS607 family transposase [Acholeplasmatales bacterium]|nr:IS607 family transposase [Acholeplasmatales bacterium]